MFLLVVVWGMVGGFMVFCCVVLRLRCCWFVLFCIWFEVCCDVGVFVLLGVG